MTSLKFLKYRWFLFSLILLLSKTFAQNTTTFTASTGVNLTNNTQSHNNTVVHLPLTETFPQNATASTSVNLGNNTSSHYNTVVQKTPRLGLRLLTDEYGNEADKDSVIGYASFNQTASYGAEFEEIDEGMVPFYLLAKAIARGSFAFGDYPFDLVKNATRLGIDKDLISMHVPWYIVGVGAGLLLVLGLLVVFFAFCCCLCTGHCRPTRLLVYSYVSHFHQARVHVEQTLPTVRRVSLAAGFLILTGAIGIVTAAQANHHLSEALHQLGANAVRVLSDIVTFADHAEEDVLSVFHKLEFAKTVFFRDLDNIGHLIGGSITEELQARTAVVSAIEDLKTFETTTCLSYESLRRLNDDLEKFNRYLEEVKSAVNDVKHKCSTMPKCEPISSLVVPSINISGPLYTLKNVNDRGFSSYIDTAAAELRRIVQEIKKNGKASAEKLKRNIVRELKKVNEYKSVVTDTKTEFLTKLKLGEKKEKAFEIRNITADVDRHRNLATLSMLVLEAVPLLVLLSGAVLAPMAMKMFDDDSMRRPRLYTRRPTFCEIRCVGVYLLCGSFLFIMLSWVWMSVAVVFFAVGAPLEGLLCSPLLDPNWTVVDTLVEDYSLLGQHANTTWLARAAGMPQTNITAGSVLRACRDHQTIYTAFQLPKNPRTNLSRRLDFKKKLNISGLLEAIPIQLHPFNVLVNEVTTYLNDLSDATDAIPLKELEDLVQMNVTGPVKSLRLVLPPILRLSFLDPSVDMKVDRLKDALGRDLKQLKQHAKPGGRSLRERAQIAVEATRKAQKKIPAVSQTIVAEGTKTFEKRLAGIVDSVIQEVLSNLEEDAGSCRPLYDMVNALVLGDLCTNVSNGLNGLWLALGWLHLFVLPAVVLCVWLYRQVYKLPPPIPPPPLPVLPTAAGPGEPTWWLHREQYREELYGEQVGGDLLHYRAARREESNL